MLRILSSIQALPAWLRCFCIPSSATIDIASFISFSPNEESITRDQLSPLAAALSRFRNSMIGSPLQFSDLDITRTSIRRLNLRGFCSSEDRPSFSLSIHGGVGVDENIEETLAEIVPTLPCSQVHSLTFRVCAEVDPECWRDVFGRMLLKSIIVDCKPADGLMEALKPLMKNGKVDLSFFSLQELFLENPDFECSTTTEEFQECLASRKTAGAALLKLTCEGAYGLTIENVERLKTVVTEVDWTPNLQPDVSPHPYWLLRGNENNYNPYDLNWW
ncbi:hypothetical protein CPB83DRAFT_900907 [Crepidotus variabilis]|uniref:Uncharacterized protein n=1 Tax=Crepidotus variabilis TaxID=179855 RepID=A0A9P6E2T7_9AGAR|nr:hypothetical protein CPB83DRAFT_900907 [Crepidotus variabilis]